jgi:flagellar biosynthesis chaperone FliJ
MKMRFTLATLLRLRSLREEQERVKLAAANYRKNQAAQESERVDSLLKDSLPAGGGEDCITWGARLRFVAECRSVLGFHQKRAKQKAEEAEADALRQEQAYLGARRDFEILESFREKQMEIFRTLDLRQRQRELDESYALVHARQTGQVLPIGAADVAQEACNSHENTSHGNIGSEQEDL